jgi:hypothetical protein
MLSLHSNDSEEKVVDLLSDIYRETTEELVQEETDGGLGEEESNENIESKFEIFKKLEKIQMRLKGEYCAKKEDCLDDSNLICLNNKCTCLSGYQL